MSRLARLLLLAAVVPLPARGTEPVAPPLLPLSLHDVLRAAADRAPLAIAAAARRDASDASAAKARHLPNPEATVRVENWRRGTGATPFDAHADLDVIAELSQPLPVFGSWSSRRDEAAARSRAARATSRAELEEIVLEAARLYLGAVRGRDLVAALGFLPMALSHGAGAEVGRPLATVVIGGITTSTLLTLVVLPTLYEWIEARVLRRRPAP